MDVSAIIELILVDNVILVSSVQAVKEVIIQEVVSFVDELLAIVIATHVNGIVYLGNGNSTTVSAVATTSTTDAGKLV